jgi:8-oxo-dGTP diphosphatase
MVTATGVPRVGVGVFVMRSDRLMLIRRKGAHGSGTWSTAGGHLEFGEQPEDCAIREVWEETGVNIADVMFMGITNDVFADSGHHYITIWMRGSVIDGDGMIGAPDEVAEVGWFALDNLPQPLFLPLAHLLDGMLYKSSGEVPLVPRA